MSEEQIAAICPVCNNEMEEMTVEWGTEKYHGWLCGFCYEKNKVEITEMILKPIEKLQKISGRKFWNEAIGFDEIKQEEVNEF